MPALPFLDNDLILKISEYNLLDDLFKLLDTDPREAYVLHPAANMFESDRVRLTSEPNPQLTTAGINRAIAFASSAQHVSKRPGDQSIYDDLIVIDNIQIGESQIVCAALDITLDPLILTGDKKFIRAFGTNDSIKDVRAQLLGRMVCVEEVLRALLVNGDINKVVSGVQQAPRDCDNGISGAFGGVGAQDWVIIVDRLEKAIAELEAEVGEDLLCRLP